MISRFAVTLFVSATLLFACQPLIARMIVPLLGGAPAVWILCSLCFQVLVLAGYSYAHVVGSRFRMRTQVVLQLLLVLSAFVVLPIVVDEGLLASLSGKSPTLALVLTLLRAVGLPFFVLSTTSPLLQRWYAELGETDPYHLYAASNAGSMLSLLGYPFLVEPFLALHAQSHALHVAYAGYAILVVVCAAAAFRKRHPPRHDATPTPVGVASIEELGPPSSAVLPDSSRRLPAHGADEPAPLSIATTRREKWKDRAIWVALAFAPSSLLLGATEFVTTDIASVPLLWVIPLALYLGSFIVAFAKRQVVPLSTLSRALALVAGVGAATRLAEVYGPAWLVVGLHLALLFLASVVCHRVLALRRPHHSRLTEFYLVMSMGGVLGGAFNGLVAPVVFDDLLEYPIAIALVCAGRVAADKRAFDRQAAPGYAKDVGWALGLVAITYLLARFGKAAPVNALYVVGFTFVLPVLAAFAWRTQRPLRYAVALGGILLVGSAHSALSGTTIHKERGFFGVLKVRHDATGRFLVLQSGSTIHGAQALDPAQKRLPLTYFHPGGPCGDVLGAPTADPAAPAPVPVPVATPRRVGVIGLGVGSLAAYAVAGDQWTFFEINPDDVAIAKKYFRYLEDAPPGVRIDIEVGDARLRIRDGEAARFDVLVLDAFSSDAIPIHLVTREALAIYRRALGPGGVLLAHISNRHVELEPVFAKHAEDIGWSALGRKDQVLTDDDGTALKSRSHWVVLSSSPERLAPIAARNAAWRPLASKARQEVWTDDFANVLGAMRF